MIQPYEPVELTHPDGERTYTATTIAEYNNLVYGQGYKPAHEHRAQPAPLSQRTPGQTLAEPKQDKSDKQ